ncbi:MAG: hypothetical protein H7831_12540 [Magnetococcus sp. WYHC-3]
MKLRVVTARELADPGDALWRLTPPVISPERAVSQLHNPFCAADDAVLVLAWEGERTLAYLGLLPDRIRLDGETLKVWWTTTWWADGVGGGGLAGLVVLTEALRHTQGRLLANEVGPEAAPVMRASGLMRPFATRTAWSLRGVADPCHFLTGVWRRHLQVRALCRLLQEPPQWLWQARLGAWCRDRDPPEGLRAEVVATLDTQARAFVETHRHAAALSLRGAESLEWMARFPWCLPDPWAWGDASGYHFAVRSPRYGMLPLVCRRPNGELAAVLLLRLRHRDVRVPCLFAPPGEMDAVARLLVCSLRLLGARTLTTSREDLRESLRRQSAPALSWSHWERVFYAGPALFPALSAGQWSLQDGDGDHAFS